jgi:Leucine Rich Repeat (LRR) protein
MAVDSLMELGSKIYWDYEFVDGKLTWDGYKGKAKAPGPNWLKSLAGDNGLAEVAYFQASFDEPELTDDDMVHVGQLRGLQTVFFHQTKLTDSGIFHLRGLPQLRYFCFRGEGITNGSVQYLNSMPQLSDVALIHTKIDDDGLEELSSNKKIWRLMIGGTKITDKGMVFLSRLENLRWLDLSDTSVTDTGAKYLSVLSGLEYLNLNGTQIGDSGIASLVGLKESLEHLCIAGTMVTDKCTGDLKQLNNLRILEVDQILLGRGRREREDARRLTTSLSIDRLKELNDYLPKCSINANSGGLREDLPTSDGGKAESPIF